MQPLTSTLDDLTAVELIAYYPPPAPGTTLVQPSTDPTVYVNDPSYIKALNEQSYQKYAVDVPNQQAADKYSFAAKQWEANKSATSIPKPGVGALAQYPYRTFDVGAFDQWWAQLQATFTPGSLTLGSNAPPLFFVKPASLPPDPVILAAGSEAPAPAIAATDGPIGVPVPNNPGVFASSGVALDPFPDGYVYAGPTGIYQKHIYSNPFTAGNVRIIWLKLS